MIQINAKKAIHVAFLQLDPAMIASDLIEFGSEARLGCELNKK